MLDVRRIQVLLAVIAAMAVVITGRAEASDGMVTFERTAPSAFDKYLTGATDETKAWMRSHYYRMRGYPPFFTWYALSWAPPSHFYQDLYAIYNNEEGNQLIAEHPDWVLRDSSGRPLYIPFACSGGTCPQYAADIGNPPFRRWWLDSAARHLGDGYMGVFVDDVNVAEWRVSDGNGKFVAPRDRRTGSAMTFSNWQRYFAEFTENIRREFPNAEIEHNPFWWGAHDNPYIVRQVAAADLIHLERGFNDQGIVGGSGQWGFLTYLAHIDWLHSRGKGVVYAPSGLTATSALFELASYFLVNTGRDRMDSDHRSAPDDWWSGWSTNLGSARGGRYSWKGLLRRDFEKGLVLVNQPGASTKTVSLPSGRYYNLSGQSVKSVTLGARRGAVFTRGTG